MVDYIVRTSSNEDDIVLDLFFGNGTTITFKIPATSPSVIRIRSISDTVNVEIYDGTNPLINHPDDIQYSEGELGYNITWNVSDLHPSSYSFFMNDTLLSFGTWNETNKSLVLNVEGLFPGIYNFTLVLLDMGGNYVSDSVLVQVSASLTSSTTTAITPTFTNTTNPPDAPILKSILLMVILFGSISGFIILLIIVYMKYIRA